VYRDCTDDGTKSALLLYDVGCVFDPD
jgi:hypothetical protein